MRTSRKIGRGFIFAGVLLAAAGLSQAALISSPQTFETLNTGAVNGQGNWVLPTTNSGSATVISVSEGAQVGDVFQGDKALRIIDSATGGTPFPSYNGTATSSGFISFVAKVSSDTTGSMWVQFDDGVSDGGGIKRIGFDGANKQFLVWSSQTSKTTVAYTPDHWYRFDISFDKTAGTKGLFTVTIFDTATHTQVYKGEDFSFATQMDLKRFTIRGDNANTGTIYLDNITSTIPEPGAGSLIGLGGLMALRRRRK